MSLPSAAHLENFAATDGSSHPSSVALSQHAWDNMPRPATKPAATPPESLIFNTDQIYRSYTHLEPVPQAEANGMTKPQIESALHNATAINFTSPAQDARAGRQPDYILGEDGKLRPNPNATPSKDGSITIEVASKNKDEIDAKKLADQLQKATIKDLLYYFKNSHPPGTPLPQDWLDQLNKEPDLPAPVVPLDQPQPAAPPPADNFQPQPSYQMPTDSGSGGSYGGGSPGGGSGGSFGGDAGGSGGSGAGSGGDVSPSGATLSGGEVATSNQIMDMLTQQYGFSPAGAAAVVGNMTQENSLHTDDNAGGLGLCQWTGDRRTALIDYAQQHGESPTSVQAQVGFMVQELQQGYPGLLQELKSTNNPEQAALDFSNQYERPGIPENGNREAYAQSALNNFDASHGRTANA